MGLLHKNLILAGIASVAMVGLLGSSSASALDGFSFSDIINQQQAQREQLLSYLINPFGTSTDCESTDPDSTISCNNLGNPEYAFNYTDRGASLWGYEGKGLVFNDKNSLIRREDGTTNPQLRTGRKGDTVQYSIKVDAERWFDSEETKPFYQYFITLGAEKGISFDASTLRVSVNGLELNAGDDGLGDYEIWHEDNPSAYDLAMLGMKEGATFINVTIPWINYETRPVYMTEQLISGEYYVFDSFKYAEDSVIEITIDGVIVDDVDENLDAKAIYDAGYIDDFGEPQYPHYGSLQSVNSYTSRNIPVATVLTRSNIVIQRYDDGENPVIGAEYSIDGVTAIKTGLSGVYKYSESGGVDVFTTGSDGRIIILNVPDAQYTVREISSATNNPADETVITKLVSPSDTADVDIDDIRLAYRYSDEVDVDYGRLSELVRLDDTTLISINSSEQPLVYDSESDSYTAQNWSISVKKTDGGYILSGTGSLDGELTYDAALGQYIRKVYQSDISPDMFEFEIGIKQLADKLIVDADGESMEFTKGVDDCFHLNMNNIEMSLCKNDGGYTLVQKDDTRVQEMELSCDDLSDICKYKDSLAYVVTLRESKDGGKFFSYHPVIFYSAAKDEYSIAASQMVLDASPYKNAAKATAFIFREKSDRVMPENIPNPQTFDAIPKAITLATAITITATLVFRTLRRR